MYKDPDKQREAQREWVRQKRAKEQGSTAGSTAGSTKRGKDIKCFADLPPDVPETIDMMSLVDDKIDKTIKVNRTAIAIHYQHQFPDRFHSVGVA